MKICFLLGSFPSLSETFVLNQITGLIDAGHQVQLLDGEFGPMTEAALVAEAIQRVPQAILIGHSGSTSGHPIAGAATAVPGTLELDVDYYVEDVAGSNP